MSAAVVCPLCGERAKKHSTRVRIVIGLYTNERVTCVTYRCASKSCKMNFFTVRGHGNTRRTRYSGEIMRKVAKYRSNGSSWQHIADKLFHEHKLHVPISTMHDWLTLDYV